MESALTVHSQLVPKYQPLCALVQANDVHLEWVSDLPELQEVRNHKDGEGHYRIEKPGLWMKLDSNSDS